MCMRQFIGYGLCCVGYCQIPYGNKMGRFGNKTRECKPKYWDYLDTGLCAGS